MPSKRKSKLHADSPANRDDLRHNALFFPASLQAQRCTSVHGVANDAERAAVFSCGQLSSGIQKIDNPPAYQVLRQYVHNDHGQRLCLLLCRSHWAMENECLEMHCRKRLRRLRSFRKFGRGRMRTRTSTAFVKTPCDVNECIVIGRGKLVAGRQAGRQADRQAGSKQASKQAGRQSRQTKKHSQSTLCKRWQAEVDRLWKVAALLTYEIDSIYVRII
ncbi:hypothetical protein ALC62_01654 [Cyphomyrmex costatus]|uniref:Uncharacterized protein n=1 Tax=Cyphomyrmex costatus TaxID=456900 RepID=A0A195D3H8_9HYME|nr:hypothetical protein ALC62_01654 [Cyphomyrmex costatus]